MDPEKTRKKEKRQRRKTTKVEKSTIVSKLVHVTSKLRVLCSSDRECFVSSTGAGLTTGTSLQQTHPPFRHTYTATRMYALWFSQLAVVARDGDFQTN